MQLLRNLLLASTLLFATLSNAAPVGGFGKDVAPPAAGGVAHPAAGDELKVLLRETRSNSPQWHFAFAIRPLTSKQDITFEYIMHEGKMIRHKRYTDKDGRVEFPVSGSVLMAHGEKDWNTVKNNVVNLLQGTLPVDEPIPAPGTGFNNCFDLANMAFTALHSAKYISDDTMNEFTAYYNAKKAEVRRLTDSSIYNGRIPAASSSGSGAHVKGPHKP